ncbi:hypothetical protein CHARACLAT_007015 [Characodon lateralis]|uniref:Uncharacterized protein n=1 Tax=Characodon lateralis TaxID=208331 RepID=A0ABU7F0X5_9TELE|nr:hypothetical protein [Characodon lateralis]
MDGLPLDVVEPGGEVTGVHHSLDYLLRSILGGGCQQLAARVLSLSGLPEPDLVFLCGTLPGFTTILSTLLLPPRLLLKTLDLLIILAQYYSTIICLTGKQLFGLSASHPLADHSFNPLVSRFQFPCPRHCTVL